MPFGRFNKFSLGVGVEISPKTKGRKKIKTFGEADAGHAEAQPARSSRSVGITHPVWQLPDQ